jgi:hypothetical protein
MMRILNWNFARRTPESWQAGVMVERIRDAAPDIAVLTEAHETSLTLLGGHVLSDAGVRWGGETETERKVLLWSKQPWREPTHYAALSAIGGAVSGITETPLGDIRVLGVCTPHNFAAPETMEPRPPLWSQHIAFLEALGQTLEALPPGPPLVIAGNFNQSLPLAWGSWQAHHALVAALSGYPVLTKGDINPLNELTINHIAAGPSLRAGSVRAISRFDSEDKPLSDTFGVVADLETGGPGGVAVFD